MSIVLRVHKNNSTDIKAAGGAVSPDSDVYEFDLGHTDPLGILDTLDANGTPYAVSVNGKVFEGHNGYKL
ncbi:hypothetical protein ACAX43_12595 [Paraburkholderia sp. IW21]|uniref:hypothetical protein n=1 Tax=Paraburkholderia sp. IW21 TaxID=3242488 RepID=UPI00352171B9